jgi:hypothetical protein
MDLIIISLIFLVAILSFFRFVFLDDFDCSLFYKSTIESFYCLILIFFKDIIQIFFIILLQQSNLHPMILALIYSFLMNRPRKNRSNHLLVSVALHHQHQILKQSITSSFSSSATLGIQLLKF